MAATEDAQIAVIGGGIWGLSTAYHLVVRGARSVRVLERGAAVAQETTPRAAGLIGQIRSSPVMCAAVRYALDLLSQLAAGGADPGLRRPGSLLVALTPERMAAYERQVAAAVANGVDAAFVDDAEMERLCPGLDVRALEGGYFVAGDGYVDPGRCAQALAAAARELGVRVDTGVEVTGLQVTAGTVRAVDTTAGPVPADRVVVTAGPWGSRLLRRFGVDELPLQTIRHQRVRTVPVAGIPDHHPVVRVTDVSCYVRPEQGGYLYGFFEPEPTLVDLDALPEVFRTGDLEEPRSTMAEAARRLAPVFPALDGLQVAEYIQGVTSFAPDGGYLIGPVEGVDGLFAASGCAALGIAGAPAIGRWLAGWVLDGDPGDDVTDFDLQRFGQRSADRDWVRQSSRDFYATYYDIR